MKAQILLGLLTPFLVSTCVDATAIPPYRGGNGCGDDSTCRRDLMSKENKKKPSVNKPVQKPVPRQSTAKSGTYIPPSNISGPDNDTPHGGINSGTGSR